MCCFPPDGVYTFFVRYEAKPGVSLLEMERITEEVEKFVDQIPKKEMKNYLAQIGIHQNDPNDPFTKRASHYAQIRVNLVPHSDRDREVVEIVEEFRKNVQMPKEVIRFTVVVAKSGPPQGRAISLNVFGDEFEDLKTISNRIKKELALITGVIDIQDSEVLGKKEVRILPDPIRINQSGLTVTDIATTVRAALREWWLLAYGAQ